MRYLASTTSRLAPPDSPDGRLAALAARQFGLFTRAQALACGLSASTLAKRLRAGRYVRVRDGVYAIAGISLRRVHELASGLLFVGGEAALSHASAAEVHDLPLWPDPRIHVLVRDRSWRGASDLAVHRTRWWDDELVTEVDGLRVTTAERTIVDLAGRLSSFQLRKAVTDVVRRKQATPRRILEVLDAAGRVRGAVQLREILEELSPLHADAANVSESAFVDLTTRHDIPPTAINYPTRDVHGRRRYLDAVYLPEHVPVELDGGFSHSLETDRHDDEERERAILATGIWRPFVRFHTRDVFDRPAYVITTLMRALEDARAAMP